MPQTSVSRTAKYRRTHPILIKTAHNIWNRLHPEYRAVATAKQRCTNPNNPGYKYYGGRGIECRLTYEELLATIGPRPSPKYSIDRINNDGHYEVGNIRWATKRQQNANQRRKSN